MPKEKLAPLPEESKTEATYFDVKIKSIDGTVLAATLYQPALAPGETAPLIIQTHGFGGHRTFDPRSIYGLFIVSGETAIEAWKKGYWVLSYDQRGFGFSGGEINLMHPDKEVEDMSSVIDWAEENLSRVTLDEKGDMVIGSVGESYGGAVQILASMKDPRLDAIVPIATWYDLEQAMAPNGHVKGAWGGVFAGLGSTASFFRFGMILQKEYLSMISGEINGKVSADLAIRSPSHYCNQGQSVQADALFLQGFRDTLFPVNQGISNWQCADKNGHDSRLIAIQDGHILPWPTQAWSGFPLFNTQPTIHCGEEVFNTNDMIVSWFDLKLKKIPQKQDIPKLCVTTSDDEGLVMNQLMTGGDKLAIRKTSVKLMESGWFELMMTPVDELASLTHEALNQEVDLRPADQEPVTGGGLRPAFIPVEKVMSDKLLAGIPRLDARFTTTTDDKKGTAYVAIGLKRHGSDAIEIINEQFTPLPGDNHYELELPAVVKKLEAGDVLGVVVQGFTMQYWLNPEGWFSFGDLEGDIYLPLIDSAPPPVQTAQAH